jgi:hypothetical protein
MGIKNTQLDEFKTTVYEVETTPTFIFVNENNRELFRSSEILSKEVLQKLFRRLHA